MPNLSNARTRNIRRWDRIARWVITLGGVLVIASVAAILLLIVSVTLPLFLPAKAGLMAVVQMPASLRSDDVVSIGIDLDASGQAAAASILTRDGIFTFVDPAEDRVIASERVGTSGRPNAAIQAAERLDGSRYSLLWSDGAVSMVEVTASPHFDPQGDRTIKYAVQTLGSMPADVARGARYAVMRRAADGQLTCVTLADAGQVVVRREVRREADLFGTAETETVRSVLRARASGNVTAITLSRDGSTIYAGTDNGLLVRWALDERGKPGTEEVTLAFRDKRAISALAMALGDVSLVVGDALGGLTTWFPVRGELSARLRLIHALEPQRGAVREILPSARNRSVMSLGSEGTAHLDHLTSERHLLTVAADRPLQRLGCAPRGNALVGLDDQSHLWAWKVDCPHPEVSWRALFGKVFYEGYEKPTYAWQTTGGEEFEPKMSLVPLLFGTVKGTLYAMLLAVPLALAGAAYTSHFTAPALKRAIKPTVEIMAALPSVVIGFLIALWLAPILERWVLAAFMCLATIPALFLVFMFLWQMVRRHDWARRAENGYEFLLVLPALVLGVALAVVLTPPLEQLLFEGNLKQWLFDNMHVRYDQRNSIIIAFGLGFAVIPIIFSIAEDSLSNVPHHLTAASLALGASRWQTLWRVIIPSASPGIFAGVMIGFGRAVGETMIVLMATGNTPILDWSPLNGMRTLSANIAVEIPEAPVEGTLYRVLFLCAVLLFVLTFALNTAAELVRQRLRKQYGRF